MEKRPNKKTGKSTKTRTTTTIRKQFDPTYNGSPGETNTLPSRTQPDMSLSVLELMKNHTRNIQSDVSLNEGQFFGSEIPREDLDITERIEQKQELHND